MIAGRVHLAAVLIPVNMRKTVLPRGARVGRDSLPSRGPALAGLRPRNLIEFPVEPDDESEIGRPADPLHVPHHDLAR
jgi:hypothetical protein